MDDGTFPALLKTLSDSSEEVIKQDLKLLAQISSTSDDAYFRAFMVNLLALFSTDKKLLETRGSLIIRQLCFNLTTDRVYRAFAEILEKEEVCCVASRWELLLTTWRLGPRVRQYHRAKAEHDFDNITRAGRLPSTTENSGDTGK